MEQKAPKEADNGSSFTIPPEDDAFEVLPEKIILYEVLGEGAFGVVRKGWLPDLNREVAVKMLKGERDNNFMVNKERVRHSWEKEFQKLCEETM